MRSERIPVTLPVAVARMRVMDRRGAMAPKAGMPKVKKPEPVAFHNSDGSEMKRPALQGFATLWNTVSHVSGRDVCFEYACFGRDPSGVHVRFDHDPSRDLGASGLSFANTGDGLAFRLELADHPHAAAIKQAVESRAAAHVSVGGQTTRSTVEKVDGKDVQFVQAADLYEISLCLHGAVEGVYAKLVDLDREEPDLFRAARSAGFMSDKWTANLLTRVDRIGRFLKDTVIEPEPAAPKSSRQWTLGDSARWQTDETLARQRAARARL